MGSNGTLVESRPSTELVPAPYYTPFEELNEIAPAYVPPPQRYRLPVRLSGYMLSSMLAHREPNYR